MIIKKGTHRRYLRHILSRGLDSHRCAVTAGVAVHAAHHRRNGRLLPITRRRMCDVSTQEDDGLLEHGGPGPPTGHTKERKDIASQACTP